MFILHNHFSRLENKNIRSNQDVMRASKPTEDKYKRVCEDFPNLAIFTKSATPGGIRLTFGRAAVGNNSLGKSVLAFSLAGDLSSPSMIYLNIEIAFAADGGNICLPIAEVLLRAAAGDLARSKNHRDWTPRNAVLLPPFLTEAAILHGDLDAGDLLNIFSCSITELAKEEDITSEVDEANENDSVVTIEAKDAKAKPGKTKQVAAVTAAAKMLTTIADDCDDVLAFLQAVAVKYP